VSPLRYKLEFYIPQDYILDHVKIGTSLGYLIALAGYVARWES
jgi:hypothetical protein